MSDYKYAISVEQSHGHMSNFETVHVWKQKDISEIYIPKNFFTQVGEYPNSAMCKQIVIEPSCLTIPVYISMYNTNPKLEIDILQTMNSVVKSDIDCATITLSLDELPNDNYQRIKIWKMKVN